MMSETTQSRGSASPTGPALHHSGEEEIMNKAYDYYHRLEGKTKAEIIALAEEVRRDARTDIALLTAWNVWLCDAIDVAHSLAPGYRIAE